MPFQLPALRMRNIVIRLMIGVLLIEVAMLGLLVWNSVRVTSRSHEQRFEQMVQEEARMLHDALAPAMALWNQSAWEESIERLKQKGDFVYASLYDHSGQWLAVAGEPPYESSVDSSLRTARSDGRFDLRLPVRYEGELLGQLELGFSVAPVETFIAETRMQNGMLALTTLVLTVAVTVALGLRIARRVGDLQRGALELNSGNLSHRITNRGQDELDHLAATFNQLAGHLEKTRRELGSEHQSLLRETHYLDSLLNSVNAVVYEASVEDMCFTFVSQQAEQLLQYPRDQWLEPGFWLQIVCREDRERLQAALHSAAGKASEFSLDYRVRNRAGSDLWLRQVTSVEMDAQGRDICRGLLLNIDAEKRVEERLSYVANHDFLTGLLNRRRFSEELDHGIELARRYQRHGALLLVDLDQFKYINDTYGHRVGDQFLIQAAKRIESSLRRTDVLARLGGDEFGIILPEAHAGHAEKVARSILQLLSTKVLEYAGNVSNISASIGIALLPQHAEDASALLAKADSAMYMAKKEGRNRYHLYRDDGSDLRAMEEKVHWEQEIRQALEQDRLVLHYLPVVDLANASVVQHKALLRLLDHAGRTVMPSAFMDAAERFALASLLDRWVLRRVLSELRAGIDQGQALRVSMCVSGAALREDAFLAAVKREIATAALPPGSLILEFTEAMAMEDLGRAQHFVETLRAMGCGFALSGFGVAVGAVQYFKHLSVDYVGIDASLIRDLDHDRQNQIVVRAIQELARELGVTTIAEFVEQEAVCAQLRALGVGLGQGYYFAQPSLEPCASLQLQMPAQEAQA